MDAIPTTDDGSEKALQALAETFHVPEVKVFEVYESEYRRLAAESRITNFVSVLAMRNTRSILRDTRAAQ